MRREWEQRAESDAFGYIGRGYAENDAMFWASGETDIVEQVLDGITLDRSAAVLEIGCGVGRLIRPFAHRVASINGVDIAPGMIARGRELLAGQTNVHLYPTDGTLGMFEDNTLDFVFSFVVFQHIPAKSAIVRYIKETARILKSAGIFKFQVDGRVRSIWRGSDTWLGVWFSPKEIKHLLKKAGFSIIDTWGEETQYYWITARLDSGDEDQSVKCRALTPSWNVTAVEELLNRLGIESDPWTEDITSGQRSLHEVTRPLAELLMVLPAKEYVQTAFRTILNREVDESGLKFYMSQLDQGVAHTYILDCLLSSAELRAQVRRSSITKP